MNDFLQMFMFINSILNIQLFFIHSIITITHSQIEINYLFQQQLILAELIYVRIESESRNFFFDMLKSIRVSTAIKFSDSSLSFRTSFYVRMYVLNVVIARSDVERNEIEKEDDIFGN